MVQNETMMNKAALFIVLMLTAVTGVIQVFVKKLFGDNEGASFLESIKAVGQQTDSCPFQVQDIADFINKMEAESVEIDEDTFEELERFQEYLKNILDIRCSWFRSRTKRIELQEQLTQEVLDSKSQVVALAELEEIFNNDHKFCADRAENNGKLRQVYIKLWKTRTVRNIYRRVVDGLKQAFS